MNHVYVKIQSCPPEFGGEVAIYTDSGDVLGIFPKFECAKKYLSDNGYQFSARGNHFYKPFNRYNITEKTI